MTKAKILKAVISGSFIAGDKETESFDGVVGYLPALDDDKAHQMIVRRYAGIWVGQAKDKDGRPLYKRVARVRQCFVDSVEDVEGKQLSYVGKDIMQMNFEEIQDLAAAKDLAGIPLYKTGSLTHARRVAFSEYAIHVLGMDKKELDWRQLGFNPNKWAAINVDGEIRRSSEVAEEIEDSINQQMASVGAKPEVKRAQGAESPLSLEQLKSIAKSKGIDYNANIGFKELYKRVYPEKAA